jgi:cell division GTPase FtsZ
MIKKRKWFVSYISVDEKNGNIQSSCGYIVVTIKTGRMLTLKNFNEIISMIKDDIGQDKKVIINNFTKMS